MSTVNTPKNTTTPIATNVPEHVEFNGNGSKFQFIASLLSRFVGAKDLVSMRISLPANLMEPQSNLEFWNYVDRPDIFVSIPDGVDPLERMLRVIRFWYSKDTKWKDHQLRKPYNPILGERYICHWKVPCDPNIAHESLTKVSSAADLDQSDKAQPPSKETTLFCINEQVSHYPPISAFTYTTADARIVASGLDHVVARFTGTAFKVGPGEYNSGVYITLKDHDEVYNITHAWATVHGLLTSSPYIVVSEQTVIICPKSGIKAILQYVEESYFGRPKFAINGKIFKYDFQKNSNLTPKQRKDSEKLSLVPKEDLLCTLSGQWNGQIFYRLAGSNEDILLFDMKTSDVEPKIVQDLANQHELESQRVWQKVTEALLKKDFTTATKEKRIVEDRQRHAIAERHKLASPAYTPVHFDFNYDFMQANGVAGPPVNFDKGHPRLKPGVLEQLVSQTKTTNIIKKIKTENIEVNSQESIASPASIPSARMQTETIPL
ncbi:hypothetical protein MT418_003854 [Batrachochytrium dendrobatidis]